MWPFIAASSITFYLVSKAQDMGVKCASLLHFCSVPRISSRALSAAETWRNDPRNPYAAQIAKEAHH